MLVKFLKLEEKEVPDFQRSIEMPIKSEYRAHDNVKPSDVLDTIVYEIELFREIDYSKNIAKDTYIATSKDVRAIVDKLYTRKLKTAIKELELDIKNMRIHNEMLQSDVAKLTKDNHNLQCRIDTANRMRFFERLVWLFKGGSI